MRWIRATAVELISAAIAGVLAFVGIFLLLAAVALVWDGLGWLGYALYHVFSPRDWLDVGWAKDLLGVLMIAGALLAALLVGTTYFRSELEDISAGDEASQLPGAEGRAAPDDQPSADVGVVSGVTD